MKKNHRYFYLIDVKDAKAFSKNKSVGFFSNKKAITSYENANKYWTYSGAERRIERIKKEGNFSKDYSFHIATYDRHLQAFTFTIFNT